MPTEMQETPCDTGAPTPAPRLRHRSARPALWARPPLQRGIQAQPLRTRQPCVRFPGNERLSVPRGLGQTLPLHLCGAVPGASSGSWGPDPSPPPLHGSLGRVILWGGPFGMLEVCSQHRAPPSQREQHPARHDSQNHLQTSPCGPRAARTEIPALMLQRVSKRTGCEECAPASGAPRVRCRTLTSATVLIAGSWDQLPHPIGLCTERGACLGFSLYLSSAPPGSGLG